MKFPGATLFPLVVMAILAGLTFWLDRTSQNDDASERMAIRHEMDFYADQFVLRRFATDGSLQHILRAQRMVHFPDDDSTEVWDPILQYYQGRETTVTADMAWMDKAGKHVRLKNNVAIRRVNDPGEPDMVITTSLMNVVPDDEYAYTNEPVTITRGRDVLYAQGLEADNKAQVVTLIGPAHGTLNRKITHDP